jgi:hypothetical protein
MLALVLLGGLAAHGVPAAAGADLDPGFKPELVAVELSARDVRPGEPVALTIRFRNAGIRPARADYHLFVHVETPEKGCREIMINADHAPSEPTSRWAPGQVVVDGPRLLSFPAEQAEGSYALHVGLYDFGGSGGRLLDYGAGQISVSRQAPPAASLGPKPLSREEAAQRRRALAARIPPAARVRLETAAWQFDLDRTGGAWSLLDKAGGVLWTSDPTRPAFGQIVLASATRTVAWPIERFEQVEAAAGRLRLVARPTVDGQSAGLAVTFSIEPVTAPAGLRLAYQSQHDGPWRVAAVRLLDHALAVTEDDAGAVYVPHRLGIELPAVAGLPAGQSWLTYDDLSMAMCGAVKQGSALLVSWDDVDTRLTVDTAWPDLPQVPGRRMRSLSLAIDAPQGACTLYPLGPGGYVHIAQAYRGVAKSKGWRQTWSEKRRQYPAVERLPGAADFKPFVFSRVVPGSRFSPDGKEHTHLAFTFEEAARAAEHWRRDLEIDRAFVVLAGWINGGYDVRHPDVLPAAPECGGNPALAAAAARVKACGYLFGLHDNYLDMYAGAASFDRKWLSKDARGEPKKGGNWNGGQAWQVCAAEQVALAARKDTNLPKIAELFQPSIYFIDTVLACGLATCQDPAHPTTRLDDLRWKTKLCLLAKQYFGLLGSEEGREWAVPCVDYFEGLLSHQTQSPPGSVIPMFPLVYNDCVQLMTHQGDRIGPGDEKKMADHVLLAQMPVFALGEHLYWTRPGSRAVRIMPLPPRVKELGPRRFEITYRFSVEQPAAGDYTMFVHFAQQAPGRPERIVYQNDHAPHTPTSRWPVGIVDDGPYSVEVPAGFDEPAAIRLGFLDHGERIALARLAQEQRSYHVGTIAATGPAVRFRPAVVKASTELWSRGEQGWGRDLCATDRVVKNAWEVLSPLNQIAADTPMSDHEFLSADRLLQRTRFGEMSITVTFDKPARIGDNRIPPYGFLVKSPRYIAFCALRYNGVDYRSPALFTVRSLDGRPIAESLKVRIYHGFGEPKIRLFGKDLEVEREEIVRIK